MNTLGGFDPSTMTYLATQMMQPTVGSSSDPFQEMLLPIDMQDQASTYGFPGYGMAQMRRVAENVLTGSRSEDPNFHRLPTQPTLTLKRFGSTYDDPFSDVVSAFDNPIHSEQNDAETPSIDRDNKLLSFTVPSFEYTLLDYTYRRTTLSLSAQLHGMFFLAESPWASTPDAQAPSTELTCYRRNLFQITGEITLSRALRYIMIDSGEQIPIMGQELVISATESTEGNPVKIISVPWKTPINSNAQTAEDKVELEPPAIPLDLMNVQDPDSDFATFPFQWKRLQFRIATANNGRRKELQQHFVVRLKVVATLATGGKTSICDVSSGAIIVRGRSPRNFQSRNDLPLSGSKHARKASYLPPPLDKRTSAESVNGLNDGPTSAPLKPEAPTPAMSTQSFYDPNEGQTLPDPYGWKQRKAGATGAMTALPPHTSPFEGSNVYAISSPDLSRAPRPSMPPPAPISLSLVEDESLKAKSSATPPAKKMHLPSRPPSFSLKTINSPDESADLLYEYFPLGLDDWMPPVDAVYRPHVVHHTKLPTNPRDPKTSAKGARSKRYFTEDVS